MSSGLPPSYHLHFSVSIGASHLRPFAPSLPHLRQEAAALTLNLTLIIIIMETPGRRTQ
jgi:hypothetical protein